MISSKNRMLNMVFTCMSTVLQRLFNSMILSFFIPYLLIVVLLSTSVFTVLSLSSHDFPLLTKSYFLLNGILFHSVSQCILAEMYTKFCCSWHGFWFKLVNNLRFFTTGKLTPKFNKLKHLNKVIVQCSSSKSSCFCQKRHL